MLRLSTRLDNQRELPGSPSPPSATPGGSRAALWGTHRLLSRRHGGGRSSFSACDHASHPQRRQPTSSRCSPSRCPKGTRTAPRGARHNCQGSGWSRPGGPARPAPRHAARRTLRLRRMGWRPGRVPAAGGAAAAATKKMVERRRRSRRCEAARWQHFSVIRSGRKRPGESRAGESRRACPATFLDLPRGLGWRWGQVGIRAPIKRIVQVPQGSAVSNVVGNVKMGIWLFWLRQKSLLVKRKRPEGPIFLQVPYRLNENSLQSCIQIIERITGPRCGVNNRPGRSGSRPTARRPADRKVRYIDIDTVLYVCTRA